LKYCYFFVSGLWGKHIFIMVCSDTYYFIFANPYSVADSIILTKTSNL